MIENYYIKMDTIQLTLFMIYIKIIYAYCDDVFDIFWYLDELDNYVQKSGYIFFLLSTSDYELNTERDFCPKTGIPLTRTGNKYYIEDAGEDLDGYMLLEEDLAMKAIRIEGEDYIMADGSKINLSDEIERQETEDIFFFDERALKHLLNVLKTEDEASLTLKRIDYDNMGDSCYFFFDIVSFNNIEILHKLRYIRWVENLQRAIRFIIIKIMTNRITSNKIIFRDGENDHLELSDELTKNPAVNFKEIVENYILKQKQIERVRRFGEFWKFSLENLKQSQKIFKIDKKLTENEEDFDVNNEEEENNEVDECQENINEIDEWQENIYEIEEDEDEEETESSIEMEEDDEETEPDSIILEEKNIATVVKGGKIRRKRLICVTTDLENSLGLGIAKDDNSLSAFYKSKYASFNNLIQIPITHNGSIPHLINSKFAAANLVIIPAISGTGIIAPYFLKSLLYICGISNIVTKQFGSSSILNNSIALVKALKILNKLIWHSKMRSKKLFKFYKKILK